MPKTHIVAQGETLRRIAKKHNFGSWQKIYDHPDNAEFRALRQNPEIIFPGDKVVIPDIAPQAVSVSAGKRHVFRLKREKEIFKIKINNGKGRAWVGKRVVLTVDGQRLDTTIGADGMVSLELPKGTETDGKMEIFLNANSDQPTHQVEVKLASLDPVETLSGVQARCNMLGFECGVADGVMGAKTRSGVMGFQAAHGLDVDGVPGPMTQAKLKEVYGC